MLAIVCPRCRAILRLPEETLEIRYTCPRCLAEIVPSSSNSATQPETPSSTSDPTGTVGVGVRSDDAANLQEPLDNSQRKLRRVRSYQADQDVSNVLKLMVWGLPFIALLFFVAAWATAFSKLQDDTSSYALAASLLLALTIAIASCVQLHQPGVPFRILLFIALFSCLSIAAALSVFIIFLMVCWEHLNDRAGFSCTAA